MNKICTILAFDFGTRQIGVAIGQALLNTANPLTILRANDGIPDWKQLKLLIDDWEPDQILVGLPLNMDGSESNFCQRTRKFGRRIHGKYGVKVAMVDERLSTFSAKNPNQVKRRQNNRTTLKNYRENPIDHIAAVIILQTWLSDPTIGIEP